MNRRRFIGVGVGAGALAGVGWRFLPKEWRRVERKSWALGAEVSLTVCHRDSAVAESALDGAFKALEEIEQVLSLYRAESEICRLNRAGFLDSPHPDLANL